MAESNQSTIDEVQVDKVIANYQECNGKILGILEDLQELDPHHYLPMNLLKQVAVKTKIPLSQIYSVATFYSFFNLTPQGNHTISICRGTACHTRGSRNLLESLKSMMDVRENDMNDADKVSVTTPDNEYTIRTVACFGQCAMAPVVSADHTIYGHMTELYMKKVLQHQSEKETHT